MNLCFGSCLAWTDSPRHIVEVDGVRYVVERVNCSPWWPAHSEININISSDNSLN